MKKIIIYLKMYFKYITASEYSHYKLSHFWTGFLIPVFIIFWIIILIEKLIN
jgi:hypothetical protein